MSVDVTVENTLLKRKLAAYEEILKEKERDTLTDLYSRQRFFEETRELLNENPKKKFVFLRFDINRFQLVNSFFGLEEGDKLLQYLAFKIKQFAIIFQTYIIGRIEGDVFGMCCRLAGHIDVFNAISLDRKSVV